MTLNVFTHPINNPTIDQTVLSFIRTFGNDLPMKVWEDGRNTKGLADGYIKAVKECKSDYIFMLEHDWEFIHRPEHSLKEIIKMMNEEGIVHLRFNKRKNEAVNMDTYMKDKGWYCATPFVSNNPHIISRKAYLGFIEQGWIKNLPGSRGIEEELSNYITGAVYGGVGYRQVIKHLNGGK